MTPGLDDGAVELLASSLGLRDGQEPFPWQVRLLRQFREGEVCRCLDIPTGLGKTATIAIWLIARAMGASLPRRLVYIVDRRAVVDQATRVAENLRRWVGDRPPIRTALGLGERQLPVSTLRGKLADNREWLEEPAAPAIIVGTVDMIGSRLLFQGYRASRRIRPYMAGLLGRDSFFVLDEAHLVPPFERLLERVLLEGDDLGPVEGMTIGLPVSRLLSLSATGRSKGGTPFDLDDEDLRDELVLERLGAKKWLTLERQRSGAELARDAAVRAWQIAGEGRLPVRCVVFLSRREDAEKARDHLSSLAGLAKVRKGQEAPAKVQLLVGARRVFERQRATEQLEELGFLAGREGAQQCPVFLFATSAGEVGVDLDADHAVCDLVEWERMVQRLGRVNRRGRGDATVVVLDEAVRGKGMAPTADRRVGVRTLLEELPCDEGGRRDVSPGALRKLQEAARRDSTLASRIAAASTPEPLHPGLDRPTLDDWAMTSLGGHPGRPLVAPWLRGWVENRPQTTVFWRRRLPLLDGGIPTGTAGDRFFEAAPPHASELLETETSRVAEWLAKRAKKLVGRARKGGGELGEESIVAAVRPAGEEVWNWLALDRLAHIPKKELERTLAGADLLVVAGFGGLSLGLLDVSADDVPPTLDVDASVCEAEGTSPWIDVPYRVRETDDRTAIEDSVWRERERVPRQYGADGEVAAWLVVEKRLHDSTTEEDRSAGRPQHLAEHQAWTAERARALAIRLELGDRARRVLEIAARLHDEGKRAARWQSAFHAPQDGPYAKTRGPMNARLLDGYRHEFGSLPYAEGDSEVLALSADDRDLVLHLIASHHGFARPFLSTRGCEDGPPSALEVRARSVAIRFFRLQARWGPWGLAWWESLLRAADQQASRDNDRGDTWKDVGEDP